MAVKMDLSSCLSACTQGCRPVGRIAEVTETKGNSITQLDGLPALEVVCSHT